MRYGKEYLTDWNTVNIDGITGDKGETCTPPLHFPDPKNIENKNNEQKGAKPEKLYDNFQYNS